MNKKDAVHACDVAVVYSGSIAHSAKERAYREDAPFSSGGRYGIYNDSYRYFLLQCKKMRLRAVFTTSDDIIGPGLFKSFWTYNRAWVRHETTVYAPLLFDKFTPTTVAQKKDLNLLASSSDVRLFNRRKISDLFGDKLATYKYFEKFAIPTVEIRNPSRRSIAAAKAKLDNILRNHRYRADFNDGYIIKDTTGAGGFKIFKVDFTKGGSEEIMRNFTADQKGKKLLSYVLQPFIDCTKGFVFGKYRGLIDLRVILINRTVVQTYIRVAKKGNFKCNEHQGGNLVYMPIRRIPADVVGMIERIIKRLGMLLPLDHSLYAVDFIRSNNGNVYFIEGNSNPGIDWNHKKKINEIKSKELVNLIVDELKVLTSRKLSIMEAAPVSLQR